MNIIVNSLESVSIDGRVVGGVVGVFVNGNLKPENYQAMHEALSLFLTNRDISFQSQIMAQKATFDTQIAALHTSLANFTASSKDAAEKAAADLKDISDKAAADKIAAAKIIEDIKVTVQAAADNQVAKIKADSDAKFLDLQTTAANSLLAVQKEKTEALATQADLQITLDSYKKIADPAIAEIDAILQKEKLDDTDIPVLQDIMNRVKNPIRAIRLSAAQQVLADAQAKVQEAQAQVTSLAV